MVVEVVEVVVVEVFVGGRQVISISSELYLELEGGAGVWWEEELGVVAVERKKVETNTIKMVTMAMSCKSFKMSSYILLLHK